MIPPNTCTGNHFLRKTCKKSDTGGNASFKEVLHTYTDLGGGEFYRTPPPQNENPLFSETTFSIFDLNSKNETLDHCRHFLLLESTIRRLADEKSHLENENIFKARHKGTISVVNTKAYLCTCGGPL